MLFKPSVLAAAAFGLLAQVDAKMVTVTRSHTMTRSHTRLHGPSHSPTPPPAHSPTTPPSTGPTSPPSPSTGSVQGVAGWWGQESGVSLDEACSDPAWDVIILSFMNTFFGAGGYPGMNMNGLSGPSSAQQAKGATDLLDGSPLVPAIKACQASGKKVFISLGGADATDTLTGDSQGQQLATTVWNLFLGGKATPSIRPFGSVVLDGIDLDNESHDPTGYSGLVQGLRKHMNADSSKKYFISAAPQCPSPDASLPNDVLSQTDMVWVQFYNNKQALCDNGQKDFISSIKSWSSAVSPAQIWIGAPGKSSDVGDGGYISPSQMKSEIQQVQALNLPNFAGVSFWSVESATENGNFQQQVAAALGF